MAEIIEFEKFAIANSRLRDPETRMLAAMLSKIAGLPHPSVEMVYLAHGMINKDVERKTLFNMISTITGD